MYLQGVSPDPSGVNRLLTWSLDDITPEPPRLKHIQDSKFMYRFGFVHRLKKYQDNIFLSFMLQFVFKCNSACFGKSFWFLYHIKINVTSKAKQKYCKNFGYVHTDTQITQILINIIFYKEKSKKSKKLNFWTQILVSLWKIATVKLTSLLQCPSSTYNTTYYMNI